jgi:hypothetical protein
VQLILKTRRREVLVDELKQLRTRIVVLEDLEAIKKLKARYWLCMDRKLWDEYGDCFTRDAVMDVPPATHWQGREEIVQSLSKVLNSLITVHQGHHADIEIMSETKAKATWAMYDNIQDMCSNTKMEGYGFYEDEYVKENGRWKIKNLKLTRFFVESQRIDVGSQPKALS